MEWPTFRRWSTWPFAFFCGNWENQIVVLPCLATHGGVRACTRSRLYTFAAKTDTMGAMLPTRF